MSTATPTAKPYIPPDPDNFQITDADRRLIHDWFTSNDPITELCQLHQLSITEIARWASRPEIARILETLKRLHAERFALKATAAAYDALITLHFISTTEHPTNAQEIARRAATKLIALAFPRNTTLTPNTTPSTPSTTSTKPSPPAAATKAEAPAPTSKPTPAKPNASSEDESPEPATTRVLTPQTLSVPQPPPSPSSHQPLALSLDQIPPPEAPRPEDSSPHLRAQTSLLCETQDLQTSIH